MVNADGGRVFASTTQTPQQEASLTIDARNNRPGSLHQAFDTHRIFALPVKAEVSSNFPLPRFTNIGAQDFTAKKKSYSPGITQRVVVEQTFDYDTIRAEIEESRALKYNAIRSSKSI